MFRLMSSGRAASNRAFIVELVAVWKFAKVNFLRRLVERAVEAKARNCARDFPLARRNPRKSPASRGFGSLRQLKQAKKNRPPGGFLECYGGGGVHGTLSYI